MEHNEEHGITPQGVKRAVQESLQSYERGKSEGNKLASSIVADDEAVYNKAEVLRELEAEMLEASTKLEFEKAAHLRDQIKQLKER
jgi:excinuclease ABC subunit B